MRESNPRWRFWRPQRYHYTNPLLFGCLGRDRTRDHLVNSEPLYRLSYEAIEIGVS